MGYRGLYIWVEGDDDVRFFNGVICPLIAKKYPHDFVELIKYRKMKKKRVDDFLRGMKAMRPTNINYIFSADINAHPCTTAKKQELLKRYKELEEKRIVIVKKMIESWYLAGLDKKSSGILKIPNLHNTENITKDKFNAMIPQQFDSRVDFMIEILKYFSTKTAKRKNGSFKYFIDTLVAKWL